MTKLSPSAQTVLDAALPVYDDEHLYVAPMEKHAGMIAAAALRAVADQLVPVEAEIDPLKAWNADDWTYRSATKYQREETRHQLLAIADDLEAQ